MSQCTRDVEREKAISKYFFHFRAYSTKLNRNNPFATLVTVCQNWVRHCPDADVQLQHVQMDYLRGIAMQDTNNPVLATYGIKALREYADNSHEFKDYLRALFYAHHKRCGAENFSYDYETASEMKTGLFSSDMRLIGEGFQRYLVTSVIWSGLLMNIDMKEFIEMVLTCK